MTDAEMLHAIRQFIPTIKDVEVRNALAKLTSDMPTRRKP